MAVIGLSKPHYAVTQTQAGRYLMQTEGYLEKLLRSIWKSRPARTTISMQTMESQKRTEHFQTAH